LPRNWNLEPEFNPGVNPTSVTTDQPPSKPSARKRRLVAFVLLLLSVGGIWLCRPASPIATSVTVLPPDYSIPAPPLPLPDRWIPPTWGPLWKLRYAILGKAFAVDIQTEVLSFGAADESSLPATIAHHAPLVSSNGVSAWVLPDGEIKSLRSTFLRGQNIRMQGSKTTTGEGVLTSLAMTTSPQTQGGGFTAGYYHTFSVRKLGDALELSGGFVSSEVVTNSVLDSSRSREAIQLHTNLTLAVIMRIPRGHGAFLFDTNRTRPGMAGVGLVIEPKTQ